MNRARIYWFWLLVPILVGHVAGQEDSLSQRYLAQDIETSTFLELVAWLETLDLDTRGSIEDFRLRLLDYYGLSSLEDPNSGAGSSDDGIPLGDTVTVQEAELVQLEQLDRGNLAVLRGRVRLILVEEDRQIIHTIDADEITLNEANDTLSARGNIAYRLQDGEGEEFFAGDEVILNTSHWGGVFSLGTSTRSQGVDGKTLLFTLTSDQASRSRENVLFVTNAIISSSPHIPLGYYVVAQRLYIFSPGEWAIEGGRLHVGRVPMLPLPALFLPGDSFWFNPAFGYDPVYGPFIQTTSYLIGEKEKGDSGLSFLQTASESSAEVEKILEGLFLRSTKRPKEELSDEPDDSLRFIFDVYPYQGLTFGLESSLDRREWLRSFEASLYIMVFHHLFDGPSGGKTPYLWDDASDSYKSYGQQVRFLGIPFPFRFATSIDAQTQVLGGSISFDLPFFSDPYIERDLGTRREDMDWSVVLGFGEQQSLRSGSSQRFRQGRVTRSGRHSSELLSPYLTSLEEGFRFDFRYKTESFPDDFLSQSPERQLDGGNNPSAGEYLLENIRINNLKLGFSGTLLDLRIPGDGQGSGSPSRTVEEVDPLEPIKPWEEDRPQPGDSRSYDPLDIEAPVIPVTRASGGQLNPFSWTLGYRGLGTMGFQWDYYPLDFDPQEGRYLGVALKSSQYRPEIDFRLSSNLKIYQNLASLDNNVSLSGDFPTLLWPSSADDYRDDGSETFPLTQQQLESLSTSLYKQQQLTLSQTTNLTVQPLAPLADLPLGLSFNYGLNSDLVRQRPREGGDDWQSLESQLFEFDDQWIQKHNLGVNLNLALGQISQTLAWSSDLEPVADKMAWSYTFALADRILNIRTSQTIDLQSDVATPGPLSMNISSTVADGAVSLSLGSSFDFELNMLTTGFLDAKLRGFSFRLGLNRQRTYGYDFESFSWIENSDSEELLRPESFKIGWKPTLEPLYFWHNRISISPSLNLSYDQNLLKTSELSRLSFQWSFTLGIHEFLDFSIEGRSSNNSMFQYFEGLLEPYNGGGVQRGFFEDLAYGFALWDQDLLRESSFNLNSLSFALERDLDDWVLKLGYSGSPQPDPESQSYLWKSVFTLSLQWRPIPEIKTNWTIDGVDGQDPSISFQ